MAEGFDAGRSRAPEPEVGAGSDPEGDLTPALQIVSVSKSYGSVRALIDVSFALRRGEVLGLLGDNGAGKTTLVRCISGSLAPDSGSILVDGHEAHITDPQVARSLGIETVYQDLALVSNLDVAGNLFLNREIVRPLLRPLGWMDKKQMYEESRRILDHLHIEIPSVRQPIDSLSGGQRQAVAVGRAVAWGRQILLLDEPAAALGVEQARLVLDLVRALAERGVAVLLISHNMQHVVEACHRAVVLRHGEKVGDVDIRNVTSRDLVDLITGASVGVPQGGEAPAL